ncbi:hypothetical protein D910_09821 [Dendroctonus ponderosae]|uniref:Endonuclease/exonuclease/phosphatase domain-containing protein n=1 Tax=Dendroctonus ponderosae TaxID=77166 RepID=U4UJ93_DENPD|nr:hypothetical protein D910_09821 [Dendroctonus ponderosae]
MILEKHKVKTVFKPTQLKNTSWGCRKTNVEGHKLLNYAQDLQFEIHAPSEPTHYNHNTPDILDIAISKDIYHILHVTNSDSLSSVHNPIIIDINEQYTNNPLAPISYTDWDALAYHLGEAQITVHPPQNLQDLNNLTAQITETITSALSKATILKPNSNKNPFSLPPELKILIKNRNWLKRRAKQFTNTELNKQANKLSKEIKIQISNLRNERWTELLENLPTGDPRAWKISKAMRGKTKTQFPPIHGERGVVYLDEEKGEAFADSLERQFSPNISENDKLDFEEEVDNFLSDIEDKQIPPDAPAIPPVTLSELNALIATFKTRTSPAPDQITNKILKRLPENNLNQILILINASFLLWKFPTPWKTASVVLIPKPSKNKTFPQNWRSISLLPTISKLTEKLFLDRLQKLISENQLIESSADSCKNMTS